MQNQDNSKIDDPIKDLEVSDDALVVAPSASNLPVIRSFVEKGFDTNFDSLFLSSSLKAVARRVEIKAVRQLLKSGADINRTTGDLNAAPFCVACSAGHEEIVKLLLYRRYGLQNRGE